MTKQSRRRHSTPRQQTISHSRVVWALLVGTGLVLAVAFFLFRSQTYQVPEDFEPEVEGAPSVEIIGDELVDYGDVPLNSTIETVFRFRNVGDEPLRVLGEPVVELVRGC